MRPFKSVLWICLVAVVLESACRPDEQSRAPGAPAAAPAGLSPADQLLLTTAKVGLPPSGITPADLPEPETAGANMVATYCAQCHDLPSPTMHSATDWPSVVRRMWLRMEKLPTSLNVKLPDEGGRSTMLSYLTSHALQVSGASLPPGRGRAEFSSVCSRCHALPDPRVHSAQDWLAVFLRMERNMERMNVRPPTQQETAEILAYLQR
jgi:cytochrome c5